MVKGFTPIIGLAVVMALALAAVFGSMSLANPAWAQDDPPDDSVMIYAGLTYNYDARALFDSVPNAATFAAEQDPAVLEASSLTEGTSGAADEKFPLRDDAVPAGATQLMTTVTFTMDADGDTSGTTDDQTTKTLEVTVVPSMVAERAMSGDPAAPVSLDDVELYTDYTSMIDISAAFESGEGTGEIKGYNIAVDTTDLTSGSEEIVEADATGSSDDVDAGADGIIHLKGVSEFTTDVTVTITPMCPATDGGDTTTACVDENNAAVATASLEATVAESTAVMATGHIGPQEVTLGDPAPTVNAAAAFTLGKGTGSSATYRAEADDGTVVFALADAMGVVTLTGIRAGVTTVEVTATDMATPANTDSVTFTVTVRVADAVVPPSYVHPMVAPTIDPDDVEPGKNSWYTLNFQIDNTFNGGLHDMTIKLEGFGVPSSIANDGIALEVTEPNGMSYTFNPASIGVDGKSIIIVIPDVAPEAEITKKSFAANSNFKVILRQNANISNPTAARTYGGDDGVANDDREIFVSFANSGVSKIFLRASDVTDGTGIVIPRVVQLDEEDGGLGDTLTATGLGFENGGTLHFFLDKKRDADGNEDPDGNPNAELDPGEDVLCSVSKVSGNMGSCSFEVSTPTFKRGVNYVNAVDGDGKIASDAQGGDNDFELKASIKVSPAGGSPGEIMQVQLVSFPENDSIQKITLSGDYICGGIPPGRTEMVSCASYGAVGSQGTASIAVTVPNWAVAGVQELVVETANDDSDAKVTIVGPRIVSTPQTVVANQRVSLVGTGFSPRSEIGEVGANERQIARMSIGGDPIDWERINNGRDVDVDDGGNWSASVDLPLSEATTGTGTRSIRVTDSMGRTGRVDISLAERDFTITPSEGRVGTLAVIRGVGYPSKNDEGNSFTVDVVYQVQEGTTTRVSVVPDASGRFEVQLRIPTTAAIPSTNQVEVKFLLADGTPVLENKQHSVPEGIISLSETSGGPGSTITVSGEGYKAFVNVDSVRIGNFDVTPAPKPHTDANGMVSFDMLIPGIDVGIQTIEVQIGGTTSSTGFTVTESGVNPGDIKPVAESVEPLGDNLVVVFHFNNDTKDWSFYSTNPDAADANTLTHMITGETYLIQVKASQEVILNRDTRNLTCVGGNCWNQVVW